jgi:F-type H+-transporting ATPase subunit a
MHPVVAIVALQDPQAAHEAAAQTPQVGELIIEHVSNSSLAHPLFHLPTIFGIDFSVTKHVFMLWVVAATVLTVVTVLVRRYLAQTRLVPTGAMSVLEIGVEFIRDDVVLPSVGSKWVKVWTPLLLTFFVFILSCNAIGLLPIFDVLALLDRYALHTADASFLKRVLHGGATATGNFNVTAGLAVVTFMAIIVAGTRAHGFVKHWANLIPHGVPVALYPLLIPLEIIGMFVRPFALTARLAANMTGGHVALLVILSFVSIFAKLLGTWVAGVGVGLTLAVPLAVGLSMLEMIIVLVQAYVFTLLSAVFIGMAIHSHH